MLTTERREAVLVVTLNRPEKRNSLPPELIRDFSALLAETANDAKTNVVVVTGAGTTFSSGMDLKLLLSLGPEEKVAYLGSFFALCRQVFNLPQVVIASINGPAMAGGFDLAAFCDLRLCSPLAKFAQTEVLLGITQMVFPLYKIIGLSRAKELALTGDAISAEEAYRIGLVNHLYPAEELMDQTMKLAATLASRPREALFETKRLSRELIDMNMDQAMPHMLNAIAERLRSAEHAREVEKYVARLQRRD
jgi:enoyl-CoA hydratase/carnithine racemase